MSSRKFSDKQNIELKTLIKELFSFIKTRLSFNNTPRIFLKNEVDTDILGKTAFYNPNKNKIFLFTNERHPKDILRSLAHELVHHHQNCQGRLTKRITGEDFYFQSDNYYRDLEKEAYQEGNMLFRDWEEQKRMNILPKTKELKLMEIKRLQMFDILKESLHRPIVPDMYKSFEELDNLLKKITNKTMSKSNSEYEELTQNFDEAFRKTVEHHLQVLDLEVVYSEPGITYTFESSQPGNDTMLAIFLGSSQEDDFQIRTHLRFDDFESGIIEFTEEHDSFFNLVEWVQEKVSGEFETNDQR